MDARGNVGLLQVDINGDGMMEWDEFTRFVVVKAQLHHAQMSIDQLAEYRQGLKQVIPRRGSILSRERRNNYRETTEHSRILSRSADLYEYPLRAGFGRALTEQSMTTR